MSMRELSASELEFITRRLTPIEKRELSCAEKKIRYQAKRYKRKSTPEYRERAREKARAYAKTDAGKSANKRRNLRPERIRNERSRWLIGHYGIDINAYESMERSQEGKCGICKSPPRDIKGLCVDHDHSTGAVRALLCGQCNTAIGLLRDDAEIIFAAAEYIKKHREYSDLVRGGSHDTARTSI